MDARAEEGLSHSSRHDGHFLPGSCSPVGGGPSSFLLALGARTLRLPPCPAHGHLPAARPWPRVLRRAPARPWPSHLSAVGLPLAGWWGASLCVCVPAPACVSGEGGARFREARAASEFPLVFARPCPTDACFWGWWPSPVNQDLRVSPSHCAGVEQVPQAEMVPALLKDSPGARRSQVSPSPSPSAPHKAALSRGPGAACWHWAGESHLAPGLQGGWDRAAGTDAGSSAASMTRTVLSRTLSPWAA